jgi:hypothetical protein
MQDSNCRFMRESEHAAPSTVRRRLAALSSLFKHLVRHGEAARNPVAEIERPAINRDEGTKEALILPSGLLCRRNTPSVFLGICSFLKSDEFSFVFLRRLRFGDGRRPIAV